uniref:G-protein coupled receptors family 1 profile domain-containing protein n=1 Tax=Denticeps clupeoides TaxID=299321 RepID=A0AAY4BXX1_9TELE
MEGTMTVATAGPNCTPPYSQDRVPLVALYSLVTAVGLPANLLTVYMTFLQVRRKNVLAIYLLSLSVCDLMYICTLPLWTIYVAAGHQWPWTPGVCKVTGYVFFNNMYISIFLLCYVAVVYAVESRGMRKQKQACAVTLLIVAVVALGHFPVFTMEEGDLARRRCFEPGQATAVVTGFNYARFVIGFLLPLCVLVFTNRGILVNVQASEGLKPWQKGKVRSLALAIIALFLVCFAPYHTILLIRAISFHAVVEECHFENSIYTPYTISLGLSTVNSAMNPILYVMASDNVRQEMWRGLSSFRTGGSWRPRLTDSSQISNYNSMEGAGNITKVQNMIT